MQAALHSAGRLLFVLDSNVYQSPSGRSGGTSTFACGEVGRDFAAQPQNSQSGIMKHTYAISPQLSVVFRTAPSDEGAVIFGIAKNDWGRDNEASWWRFYSSLPPSFASQMPPPSSEGGEQGYRSPREYGGTPYSRSGKRNPRPNQSTSRSTRQREVNKVTAHHGNMAERHIRGAANENYEKCNVEAAPLVRGRLC